VRLKTLIAGGDMTIALIAAPSLLGHPDIGGGLGPERLLADGQTRVLDVVRCLSQLKPVPGAHE
jgi:hypothetical protein